MGLDIKYQIINKLKIEGNLPVFKVGNFEIIDEFDNRTTVLNYAINLLNGRNKLIKYLLSIKELKIESPYSLKSLVSVL